MTKTKFENAMQDLPEHVFCDTVQSVAVHNGVARIVLGRLDSQNKTVPVLELLVPTGQVATLMKALQAVVK